MSDLSDDAEGIRALSEGGARFQGGRFSKSATTEALKKVCRKCGVLPVRRHVGDTGKEYMTCLTCGQQTEPLKSRQALQVLWNAMN